MRNQRESAVVPYPLGVGQQGFTLLELMIVVAIVGILSTLGMPAYKNYTIRARLSEAIIFADACKRSVYLAYTDTGQLPGTLAASGCFISDPSQPTVTTVKTPNVVSGLDVTAGGVIKVSIYGTRTGLGGACDLYLTPTPNTNATQWTGSSTCPPQYLPASFR